MTTTKKGANLPVKALTDEQLAALRADYPVEQGYSAVLFPRLNVYAKDQTEETKNKTTGKKEITVISEAGTFYTDIQDAEINEETGKKEWTREEIGTEVEGIVLFKRKQLRMYDQATELYTSSPVYDNDDQIIPLFCEKKQVGKGTPEQLQKEYEFEDEDGKIKSKLKEERILFVLKDGMVYQMNLRSSSMYAFKTYERDLNKSGLVPSAVLTKFGSEEKTKGTNTWNQMTFVNERSITGDEATIVMEKVAEMKQGVAQQAEYYGRNQAVESKVDEEYEALGSGSGK